MKTGPLLGFFLTAALATATAVADDKATCLDASSNGQRFKRTHMLVEAREQLRLCAAPQCPTVVRTDCAEWLAEVDADLPTVVVMAKNGAGANLVEVKVSVDGKPFASKLDGRSLPLNPGPHTFHFDGAGSGGLEQQVVIREGEKNQSVVVVFEAAPTVPVAPVAPPAAPAAAAAPPPGPRGSSSGWKTVGWVLGGAGVVGLGVGAIFGVIAINDKSGAHCDANHLCDPGTSSAIKNAASMSNVGWVAGGALLAAGAALVLFAPSRSGSHEATAGLRVAPILTATGGGVVAGGVW